MVGTAVPRGSAPGTFVPHVSPLTPYRVWPYYGTAFGFAGLGLYGGYYDPFSFGYGYGYPSSFGYGYGYGYPSSYTYSLPGFSPDAALSGAPYPLDPQGPTGRLQLKVEPRDAKVYVDGYYAGIVDDFDGHFQHLTLAPGPHHIEVRAASHEPLEFDVVIEPRHTTVYRGTLAR